MCVCVRCDGAEVCVHVGSVCVCVCVLGRVVPSIDPLHTTTQQVCCDQLLHIGCLFFLAANQK
jgi:hypothetical protein